MSKVESGLPVADILTGDESVFNPLKSRIVIYLFCLIFVIGYIMDMVFIESGKTIYIIDSISILISVLIAAFLYFNLFEISTVVRLQIIFLLLNIVISNLLTPINSSEFVSSFLRNTIILFMLVPVYGFYGGKKQIFLIGLIYLVLYISSLVRANNKLLYDNAAIIIFSSIMYVGGIYLIFRTIEKMHNHQVNLNRTLKNQKEEAEIQAIKIEQLNQNLQAINQQLSESNSTKDKLFSIIAHDLRSPFINILGLSEILLEHKNIKANSDSEKFVGIINSSAQNTLVLLDNLLNWAKTQTGQIIIHRKNLLLAPLVNEIITENYQSAKIKSINIINEIKDNIEIYIDANVVKIILRNLIFNAIKFTNTGGKILLQAEQSYNEIRVSVTDNGVGIPEEKKNTLFKMTSNSTTLGTANEKGSGLGLVLCNDLIKLMGGKIWAESNEGVGSCFSFAIPKHKKEN